MGIHKTPRVRILSIRKIQLRSLSCSKGLAAMTVWQVFLLSGAHPDSEQLNCDLCISIVNHVSE